jgi:hypothetical protein
MLRRTHGGRTACAVACVVASVAVCAGAAPALGAKLVGGGRQAAIQRAFTAHGAHRRNLIVSIRSSTVNGSWAVVESVRLEAAGRNGGSGKTVKPSFAYYHVVHGAERGGTPPKAVKADLSGDFKVAVVYQGSGSETVRYSRLYASTCAGAGGFIDQQTETVKPMSWNIQYVVDLNTLSAAVADGLTPVIVPAATLNRGASTLNATEQENRSSVDAGCNGRLSTAKCTSHFKLSGPLPPGSLSFDPGQGLEVGVPMSPSTSGNCDQDQYTIGPSLWDSGATTASVAKLGFVAGKLPGNPYAPIKVAWPFSSSLAIAGLAVSPCQGDSSACTDSMRWKGTVQLQPVGST